jgi:hypothetical protein
MRNETTVQTSKHMVHYMGVRNQTRTTLQALDNAIITSSWALVWDLVRTREERKRGGIVVGARQLKLRFHIQQR